MHAETVIRMTTVISTSTPSSPSQSRLAYQLCHNTNIVIIITVIIMVIKCWLQVAAYDQAKQLVWQRKAAIEKLAAELTSDPQETVQGKRIVEVIETTDVADAEVLSSNGIWSEAQAPVEELDVSDQPHHEPSS